MLLGGYVFSSTGPVALGAARDLTGDFGASTAMLVVISVVLTVACMALSPARVRRGVAPV
jgi:cyanate permease